MNALELQVGRARRRLIIEQFIAALAWWWFGAFALSSLALGIGKLLPGLDGPVWTAAWLAGTAVGGLVGAALQTWFRRRSTLEAALEIDRRFGLKERVSSSLALNTDERLTDVGQALVADAADRVDRLEVSERFRVRAGRRAMLPLAPAALAFGLAMFVSGRGEDNPALGTATEPEQAEQVKKSARQLQKKLAERRKEAEKLGLADAGDLFKKLTDGTKELSRKDVDRKQALVKLNDLAKELDKRRQQVGNSQQIKQQFKELKDLPKGPADKLAQAMENGDFSKAAKELEKLQQQLAKGDLDKQAKQDLAKQMQHMQKALEKAAAAHDQAKQELRQQIDKQRQAGNNEQAGKLQEQLDKLSKQTSAMSKMDEMAKQLGKAADKLKQGGAKDAQEAVDQLARDVESMKKELEESEMLDEAMEQLADAKGSMQCKKCGGEGCAACQGGEQQSPGGKGAGRGDKPGTGLGQGKGQADRPEKKTDTGFYDSNVRQNVGKGGGTVTDLVDGPSRKGVVREEIKSELETSRSDSADPLSGQRLPRDYRDHAKKYFDALREGK